MKKVFCFLTAFLLTAVSFAFGNDKLVKHTGEIIEVNIIKVGEWVISYSYPNETAEQVISKYAVERIEYASGRAEKVTEKVIISGESDWEKVILLEDKAAVAGLKRLEDIKGKTSSLGFHTSGTADKKSLRKLKKFAAEVGAQFVLLTSDKDNFFTSQSIKKGIAYRYN